MTTYNEEFNQYRIFLENIAKSITPQDSEVLIKPQHLRNRAVCHSDAEGEVIYWILKFLEDKKCPPKLVAPIVRNVLIEIQNDPRYKDPNTEVYSDLRGLAITVLEGFCIRLLDNVELNKILDTVTSHSAQQYDNDDLLPIPIRTVGASQNKRRKMEDRCICIDEFHKVYNVKDAQKASFYGVFDGHIGYLAAQYAASQLPFNFSLDASASATPIDAFYRTFKRTDEKFISKGVPSGTTAICALYHPEESRLYVAWVGDSKAMLAKQHGKIMQLVRPHRPEIERERDRIHALGGSIHFVQGAYRVNGSLNVTRSIGDNVHKTFLVSHPDCVVVELDKQEEFLVIASDGLWDHVYETDVARTVYQSITEDCENLDQIPSRLIKLAQDGNSTDNISVVVLFFKHPSQIAKNCDNLNIMESEFDNIKEVDYYNSKNFYPSEENTTSNSHAIDAKQLRWSPNDDLNNIINEEVKQTSTTTAGSTTTATNNGQFDDNLLYASDNIDTNQKNPSSVEDDNNSHHATTLGEEFLASGLDNKMDLTNFDNDQRKILDKNQFQQQQQQLGDTDADYGPETCVDVTDDVVMMTENSADTNNLMEQSTLSHSKDTLPSSDNCNPFDNKNTLDLEDANEYHLGGIGADVQHQLDDANKSTPLLSPEVEDLPLSSEGVLQYTNEGFQQSPLNEEIPGEIGTHQRQDDFEDEFFQKNGHFSLIAGKQVELEKENLTQEVFSHEETKAVADIQDYEQKGIENNDNDDGDFRSKDEEEILEKHADVNATEKTQTDLDNDVLNNLNQRNELQQTRQYLEDDIFEEKPILTGYLAETSPLEETNVNEFTKQLQDEKPVDLVEEKPNKEEFTEKEIELEEECIHLEEDVRPSEYLAMLARQEEEQKQISKVDTEFVREEVEEEIVAAETQHKVEHQAEIETELPALGQINEGLAQGEEEVKDMKIESDLQHLRKVDEGFVRERSPDVEELLPNVEEQNVKKDDEGFGAEENLEEEQAHIESELQPLRKVDDGFVREDNSEDEGEYLLNGEQRLRKIDEGFVRDYAIEDESDDNPEPLRKVDEEYIHASDNEVKGDEQEQIHSVEKEKTEEFSENVHKDDIHDDDDRLSDKVEQFSKELERLNEKDEKELNEEENNLSEQQQQPHLEEKQTEHIEELPKDVQTVELSEPSLSDNIQQEVDTNKLPIDEQISPLGDDSTAQPEKQCFEEPEKKIDEQDVDVLVEHDQIVREELPVDEDATKFTEPVEDTEQPSSFPELLERPLSEIEDQILDLESVPVVKRLTQPLLQAFNHDPDNLVEVVEEPIIKEQVKPKPDVLPVVAPQEPSAVQPPPHESCDESEDEEWKYMKEGQGEKQLLGLQTDTVVEEDIQPESPEQQQEPAAAATTTLHEQTSSAVSDKVETVKDTFESLTQNIAELAENAAATVTAVAETEPPAKTVEKVGDALENLNLSQSSTCEKLDNLEDENLSASEMNSRLNPDAKEFVPSFSPTAVVDLANGFNLETIIPPTALPQHFKDELLAQSPRKGRESNMENIALPAENEFEEEIANKPHGENGLYQEMNWKEAMHGSEKEEGPLVDSPATEESIGGVIDNVSHFIGIPVLGELSAPIGLDNAGMKDSIYVENSIVEPQTIEVDVLNTVQVLPVDDVESKNNSFELLNTSRIDEINLPSVEKDAVTKAEVQQILTLASDDGKQHDDEQLEQRIENLLMSHDMEITKNVETEKKHVPANEAGDFYPKSVVDEKVSDYSAEEITNGIGMGGAAAVAVAATAATAATKKVEAEKNQKNLQKTSAATKSKVPETKKPGVAGTTAKTVSSITAKRTVVTDSKPKAPISSSATKKPITSTIPATARPRTAPAAGSKTPTEKKTAIAASTVKSRIDSRPPSTLITRKPLTSSAGKTTSANKATDDTKSHSATVAKTSTGSNIRTSIGSTGKTATAATNLHSKPRPTTASAATTNGTAHKTTTAPKPTSLVAKSSTATTKSSLTSPRGTLTSTLRKTEALKILVIPDGNEYKLLPIRGNSNELKTKPKYVEPERLFRSPKKDTSKKSYSKKFSRMSKSPIKATSSTTTTRVSGSTNGTKTTTTTRTTTTKTLSSSTVPTAAARTTTATTQRRTTVTGTSSTATTPTSKTNHLVSRKSTPIKKTTPTNSSSSSTTTRKNLNTSVSKTTKENNNTSTPKPIKRIESKPQNSTNPIIVEQPKDVDLLLGEVLNATSSIVTPPSDNAEPKLNGIASPDDVVTSPTAPLNHPLEAEVA